nr:MAG TPA: hypothetical protein [Caudoviricetes sp.]
MYVLYYIFLNPSNSTGLENEHYLFKLIFTRKY